MVLNLGGSGLMALLSGAQKRAPVPAASDASDQREAEARQRRRRHARFRAPSAVPASITGRMESTERMRPRSREQSRGRPRAPFVAARRVAFCSDKGDAGRRPHPRPRFVAMPLSLTGQVARCAGRAEAGSRPQRETWVRHRGGRPVELGAHLQRVDSGTLGFASRVAPVRTVASADAGPALRR
jgi:hypothetical protein